MSECSLKKKSISIKNYFEFLLLGISEKKPQNKQKCVPTMSATDTDVNLFLCCKTPQNSREHEGQVNILPL